jgi:hypothetical protein
VELDPMSTPETDELVKRLDGLIDFLWKDLRDGNATEIARDAKHKIESLQSLYGGAVRNRDYYAEERKKAESRLVSLQGEVERRVLAEREACIEIARNWTTSGNAIATNIVHELEGRGAQVERLSQPSPAGWQLVPVEPTPQMVRAGSATQNTATGPGALLFEATETDIYRAMLAAAPSAPPQASQPRHRVGDNKSEYGHEG